MSSHLFSDENDANLKKIDAHANMTFVEFSKANNANQLAKEIIKKYSVSSIYTEEVFIDYILTKAPEKIRLSYAIQLIRSLDNTISSASSSGVLEKYEGNCIKLFR